MPYIDFEAIKQAVSVPRLLDAYGWKARWWTGERRRGPCLIHGSHVASRVFVCNSRQWYCHKCKTGGDVLCLGMHLLDITDTYPLAQKLCALVGMDIPYIHQRRPRKPRKPRTREEER